MKIFFCLIMVSLLVLSGTETPKSPWRKPAEVAKEENKKKNKEDEKEQKTEKKERSMKRDSRLANFASIQQEEQQAQQMAMMNSMVQYTGQMIQDNQRLLQGIQENLSYLTGPATDLAKNNQGLLNSLELIYQNQTPYNLPQFNFQYQSYNNFFQPDTSTLEFSSRIPKGQVAPQNGFPQGFDMSGGSLGGWI